METIESKNSSPDSPEKETKTVVVEKVPSAEAPKVFLRDKEKRKTLTSLRVKSHKEILDYLNVKSLDSEKIKDDDLRTRVRDAAMEIMIKMSGEIPSGTDRQVFLQDVLNDILGLGPLEDLIADKAVTEIMVNRKDQIYVEKGGKLTLSDKEFPDNEAIMAVIERILTPLGRRVDESSPMVDARLKDGSRVNAIIPPLALKGPSITIRKFPDKPLKADDLISFGALTPKMARFLKLAVENRMNAVVSGGTGSGKTTLLNTLSAFIPHDQRIVTVEDSAELQLTQEHVITLEARPPNIEGKGEITIRDLVKNCLRMRPDRIVVGECRGGEALDMLQAMNTGHDGSLTTAHANTPRDLLSRLETMVLMAGMDLPVRAIREQIASAVNLIVQTARLSDGSRKITNISEVQGMQEGVITLQEIYRFQQEGFDQKTKKVIGKFIPTGFSPKFMEELKKKGIEIPSDLFQE